MARKTFCSKGSSLIQGGALGTMLVATACCAVSARAGLVAKWDFDNYDPGNPTSAAILAPTVGSLAAIPCTGTAESTEVTDGTLGAITVVNTGLPDGDWALAIPNGAHLKIPLPSGIVHDKSWMLRIRFNIPSSAPNSLTALVSGNYGGIGNDVWVVSNRDLIQGRETLFGTSAEENQNNIGGAGKQGNNGWNAFRLVSRDVWHSFTAHFGTTGAASTLDGYRSVALLSSQDIRSEFTGDGFVLCSGGSSVMTYVASVEVWEDAPLYHDINGGTFVPAASRTLFEGCPLDVLRDMYITVKGLGTWGAYARVMSSWEHIVTTDGDGSVTGLKVDLRGKAAGDAILCDFAQSGADVAGNTLRMQWSLGWPNPYFTVSGDFASSQNYKAAPTGWDGDGYSAYNLYALPFHPLDGSLTWSMQMGTGKFGSPVFSIVGDSPTLTFDAAPQADYITLDCGRGDGAANVTFAYGSDALKAMSGLGGLAIGDNVRLTVPYGVSIPGALSLGRGAVLEIDIAGKSFSIGDVLFTAAGGVALPAGKSIGDVVHVAGSSAALSQDGTQILLVPDSSVAITAIYVGRGDRADVVDPLNWECRNYAGEVLEGRLPGAETTIMVGGETSLHYPTNQAGRLTYGNIVLTGPVALVGDCDWRPFGAGISYSGTQSIDLRGHKLYMNDGTFAADITSSGSDEPGEYHLDVAVSATVTALNMKGNVRFVKEGDGQLVLNYSVNPTYTGGTDIRSGTIVSTLNATQKYQFGAGGSEIVVRSGAMLYPYNNANWLSVYRIVMDGGRIYTWWGGSDSVGVVLGTMNFTADSTWEVYSTGKLHIWPGNVENLNGHTLSLAGAGDKRFGSNGYDVTIGEGTVDLQDGTITLEGPLNAPNTTFLVGGALNLGGYALSVSNYVARYTGASNAGTGALNVFGTFKPSAHDNFYGCTMQNGSTIDLSSRTNALPLVSAFTAGDNTLKFADNSTVYIGISNLKANSRNPAITWNEKPANIDTVKFKDVDSTSSRTFVSRADGVYALSGFMILIR